VGLTVLVAALQLPPIHFVTLTAAGFFAGGAHVSARPGHALGPDTLALAVPSLVIFGFFALNAQRVLLLGVPAIAVVASLAGALLARRLRGVGARGPRRPPP